MKEPVKDFDAIVEAVLDLVLQNPGGINPGVAKGNLDARGFFGKDPAETHEGDYAKVNRAFKQLLEKGLITRTGKIYLANREAIQAKLEEEAIATMKKLAQLNPGELDSNPALRAALFGKHQGQSASGAQKTAKPSLLSRLFKAPVR